MKHLFLLLIATIFSLQIFAQSTVDSAVRFNFYNEIIFNPPIGTQAQVGPDYGCVTNLNRPFWFYFNVCGADSGASLAGFSYLAYPGPSSFQNSLILYGPFDDSIDIANKLTSSNIDTCRIILIPGINIIILNNLQFPKFYYGLITMSDNVNSPRLLPWGTGGYWLDDRCGISNSRVTNYKQDICMVTVDSATQKNKLIWDKKYNFQTSSFNIYRESTVASVFDSIGNVAVADAGKFIDNGADPLHHSYRYRMTAVDSSGFTEYQFNLYDSAHVHTTIHLLVSPGLNNEVNLSWNAYVGFPYSTFYIYRGSSPQTLQLLDSVSSGNLSYTDFNAQPGLNYYKVVVNKQDGCSPDGGTTVYYLARSNGSYLNSVGINEISQTINLNIFPNPLKEFFHITLDHEIKNGIVKIYNVIGENVFTDIINGSEKNILCKLNSGIFFIQIAEQNNILSKKIIVE